MEKLPYRREDFDNLVVKQEGELKDMKNEAHGEALAMDGEINEHEAKIKELKGTEGDRTQEKLKLRSIELSDMVGKPLSEVEEYLKAIYGDTALARIPDDLNGLPEELKDANYHFFFGSVGVQDVPCAYWDGGLWHRRTHWLSNDVRSNYNIVLLKK